MIAGTFTKLKKVFDTFRWGQRSDVVMSKETIELRVHLDYDDEARVWFVAKSDIPGLVLEANSPTRLVERILEAAPELIELNEALLFENLEQRESEPSLPMQEVFTPTPRRRLVTPIFDRPLELV